jgi:hypothetical protein
MTGDQTFFCRGQYFSTSHRVDGVASRTVE